MTGFVGPNDGAAALHDFLFDRAEALPDPLRERLRALIRPPAVAIVAVFTAAELLFAWRDRLGPEARALGGDLAFFCEEWRLDGMGEDNRGSRMMRAMIGQEVDQVPDPRPEYLPPELEPETAQEPAPTGVEAP